MLATQTNTTNHQSHHFAPGFAVVPTELLQDESFMCGFNHTGRLRLIYLQASSGGRNEAFLSNRRLMERTFIPDEQSVIRAKNRLISEEFLIDTGRTVGRGVRVFKVNIPHTGPLTDLLTDPSQNCEDKKGSGREKETTPTVEPPPVVQPVITNGETKSVVVVSSSNSQNQDSLTPEPSPPVITQTISNSKIQPDADSFPEPSPPQSEPLPASTLHPDISPKDDAAIRKLLLRIPNQAQEVQAELQARLNGEGSQIRNPVGFVAALVKSVQNGTWAPSAARRAQEAAEAKKRQEEHAQAEEQRQRAEDKAAEDRRTRIEDLKARLSEKELEQHKQDFIAKLKTQESFTYKRLKKDNFASVGFKILFDSYLLETQL